MISRQERQTLIARKAGAGKNDPLPKVETKLPELQPMETVCLFADISGFTNLSE
jgi:class 3 adenylate cyclase